MSKKIFLGITLVSLAMMLVCTGLFMGIMYDYMGRKIDAELRDQAVFVEEAWLSGGEAYLGGIAQRKEIESRVTIISKGGEVLFDSMASPQSMENHMERSEVRDAMERGTGKAVRRSSTFAKETRYFALKSGDGSIIRLSTDHYSRLGFFMDTIGIIGGVGAVLILLGAAISGRIAAAIMKPINKIDPDNPEAQAAYEELSPLLKRLEQQNTRISGQMAELRKSREEFEIITQNMGEGLLLFNGKGRLLSGNRSAAELLGVKTGAGSGTAGAGAQNREEMEAAVERLPEVKAALERTLEGGAQAAGERPEITVFAEVGGRTLEVMASPVPDKNAVFGAVLLLVDVSERTKGERMRREFTSNVSHELKTPLTSIYGISDMMAGGMVRSEDVERFAKNIRSEAGRLISLIDDILRLSKLDEGGVQEERKEIDLCRAAAGVLARLEGSAKSRGVRLGLAVQGRAVEVWQSGSGEGAPGRAAGPGGEVWGSAGETCDTSAWILGSEAVLDEVIYNLCENAIKYNVDGGLVQVELTGSDRSRWVLKVRDSGIGIPKEDLDRVFERFYRVDKSHSRKIGGTGLGLSIVKHGVSFLGGQVSVSSRVGEGTEVTVVFPGAKSGAHGAESVHGVESSRGAE